MQLAEPKETHCLLRLRIRIRVATVEEEVVYHFRVAINVAGGVRMNYIYTTQRLMSEKFR